jgi:hypothetical protein
MQKYNLCNVADQRQLLDTLGQLIQAVGAVTAASLKIFSTFAVVQSSQFSCLC